MRINSINSALPVQKNTGIRRVNSKQVQTSGQLRVISLSEYMASPISFKGRNKEQAIFYGAEVAPYSKAGGVGVVMKDYGFMLEPKDEVVVSPYYRADVDKKTGQVTPAKDEDGDYILHTNSGDLKLDLIAEKNMQWGKRENNKIMLFSLRDEAEKVHYFVFDDATAHYKKPYEGGTVYASGAKSETNEWNGDPYAKNSKAFVELLPELIASKKDFNPATVVCSDSQTAYTHEYIVQKAIKDDKYDEIKTTHVGHNLGPGYCGETSMQNMFVNLGATPQQISMVEQDPLYKQGILGDDYFKPFVKETLDETGTASATQIALHHADKARANGQGFVKSFSVVAEDYADSLATNPQAAYNIHHTVQKLYQDGTFNGILNPLEDDSIDATKKLPNPRYNENCIDKNGTEYAAFETYPKNVSFEEMRRIKNSNKQKLLERLSAEDVTIATGDKNRAAKINPEAKDIYDGPVIRPELIEMIKNGDGDKVPLFVSWGRIDTQKGHDISLSAFEKFAKTEEGKNAIFILGAGLDKGAESARIAKKIQEMLKDPDLQGRLVHIDGWAPAYAMSSAADAAVFTSRFEPCGLTDIEAMKYYCTPIVTNTQGFKQKNFDPRKPNEADKATSFKTQHEFDLLKSQVDLIIDGYVNGDEDAKEKVKAEFPIFKSNENGIETYNDSAFVTFAEKYKEFIDAKKQELSFDYPKEEDYPKGWNDWDELSKDYAFKYTGFARDLKDTILAHETAEAINAYVNTPTETKSKMFSNLKSLETSWQGNANLHPTNKSSYELYRERHMMSDYSKPVKADLIAKDDSFIKNNIESRQHDDMKGRIGTYLVGALTGLSGLLFARTKNADFKGQEDKLNAQIAELQRQLLNQDENIKKKIAQITKANRKNMVVAGVVSAIGAAVLTYIGTKKLLDKKQQNTQTPPSQTTATATTASTPITAKPEKREEKQPEKTFTAVNSGTSLFSDFKKYV